MKNVRKLVQLMLDCQDRLNAQIEGNNWRESNLPWYRAIWMECAELMDCFPWKWWAKKEIDKQNALIEIVDAWHFVLSWSLQENHPLPEIMESLEIGRNNCIRAFSPEKAMEGVELMARLSLKRDFAGVVLVFHDLMNSLSCDVEKLAKIYFAKNVLNQFRQKKGLKKGTYRKHWNGVEDNVVMLNLVESVDLDVDDVEGFQKNLMDLLEREYEKSLIEEKASKKLACA